MPLWRTQRQDSEDEEDEEEMALFSDELDPAEVTLQAQRSLHKLRQRRDDCMKRVRRDTLARLAAVRRRASATEEASQQQRTLRSKRVLLKLLDLLKERRETEDKFDGLFRRTKLAVNNYVELVLAGCGGRHEDTQGLFANLQDLSKRCA